MKNKFLIEWSGGTVLPTEANKATEVFLRFLKDAGANIKIATLDLDGKTISVLTGQPVHAQT